MFIENCFTKKSNKNGYFSTVKSFNKINAIRFVFEQIIFTKMRVKEKNHSPFREWFAFLLLSRFKANFIKLSLF